jgi:cephalosporin hydroxylase
LLPRSIKAGEGGVTEVRKFNVLVEPVDRADAKAAAEEAFRILMTRGIEIDPASLEQTSRKINGFDASDFTFAITSGREVADFTLVEIKAGGHFMAVLYYGSDEGMKANAAAMTSIVESIQPIKK